MTRYRKESRELNKDMMKKNFLFEVKPKKAPKIKVASVTTREDGGFLNIETAHNQFKPNATDGKDFKNYKTKAKPKKSPGKAKSMPKPNT